MSNQRSKKIDNLFGKFSSHWKQKDILSALHCGAQYAWQQ